MRELWWVDPELESQLTRVSAFDVARWSQVAADATWLSSDRQSGVARVESPVPLLVKWRHTLARRRGKTLGRASKERREARAYLRLARRGMKTPMPWAVGERRQRGRLVGSVLIRPFHEHCVDAREKARDDPSVLERLGQDLRSWHDTGFRHGDCYPKNVLVPDSGAPPLPLGCPAARFVPRSTKADRRRRKDLAQWAAGVLEAAPERSPFAFLESYCQAPGLDAARLQKAVRPHFDRILKQKERREVTREAREGETPPRPVPLREDATRSRRIALASLEQAQPH